MFFSLSEIVVALLGRPGKPDNCKLNGCEDVKCKGHSIPGLFDIYISETEKVKIFCDLLV